MRSGGQAVKVERWHTAPIAFRIRKGTAYGVSVVEEMVAGGLYTPEKKTLSEANTGGLRRPYGYSPPATGAATRIMGTSCVSWWWGCPA